MVRREEISVETEMETCEGVACVCGCVCSSAITCYHLCNLTWPEMEAYPPSSPPPPLSPSNQMCRIGLPMCAINQCLLFAQCLRRGEEMPSNAYCI